MSRLGLISNGFDELTQLPAFWREKEMLNTQKIKVCAALSQIKGTPKDFTLLCADGCINVHKQLLADSCDNLREFLNSEGMKQRTFMLCGGRSKVMLTIVHYLYGVNGLSNLLIWFTDLVDVVWISHSMQLSETWINHCYRVLTSRFLSVSNFYMIWRLTQRLGNIVNTETIEKFFKDNLIMITKSPYMEKFDENEMLSLLRLFDQEQHSELMVEVINVWRLRGFNRENAAGNLLKIVRNMNLKSSEFLRRVYNCYRIEKSVGTFGKELERLCDSL